MTWISCAYFFFFLGTYHLPKKKLSCVYLSASRYVLVDSSKLPFLLRGMEADMSCIKTRERIPSERENFKTFRRQGQGYKKSI